MRIVHIIQTLHPDYGGPPRVAASLAAAQATLGHASAIVSYARDAERGVIESAMAETPGITGVACTYLVPGGAVDRMMARAARRSLPSLLRESDVVHVHGVWEPIVKAGADVARAMKVPYVVRPYGTLDAWSMRQKRMKKQVALRLGYRRMLNDAECIHALNADEAELIKPLKLKPPVRVIPNGVFPNEFASLPAKGRFRAAHSQLGSDPFVLFLSRLHFKKGLDYLADAFAIAARAHPRLKLVVAGPDGGAQAEFETRIAASGLTNRVLVTGPLYGSAKISAMVDATCFCLPSRQEGFSVAITEALACGTPVVISTECHFPEVAEHHAGEVVPLDARAIADSLLRVVREEGLARRMGEAARTMVLTRYTWPVIAQQTLDMYAACERHAMFMAKT